MTKIPTTPEIFELETPNLVEMWTNRVQKDPNWEKLDKNSEKKPKNENIKNMILKLFLYPICPYFNQVWCFF